MRMSVPYVRWYSIVSVATQYRTNDLEAADGYMRQSLNVIFHGAMPEGVARGDDWAK